MSTLSLGSPRFTRQRTIAPAFPATPLAACRHRPRCRNRIDRRRRRLRQRNAPAVSRCRAGTATSFRSQRNLRSFDAGREQALLTAGVDDVNLTPQRRLRSARCAASSCTAAPIRHEIKEEGAVARELCSADPRNQTIRDRLTSEDHPAVSGQCPSDRGDLQVEGGWQDDHALERRVQRAEDLREELMVWLRPGASARQAHRCRKLRQFADPLRDKPRRPAADAFPPRSAHRRRSDRPDERDVARARQRLEQPTST